MTVPVTRLGPRSPLDNGYACLHYGPSWLPSIQSPSGTPPTIASIVVTATPNDTTISGTVVVGTDLYFKPTGGTAGITYLYAAAISLSDGQFFSRSVEQPCVSPL